MSRLQINVGGMHNVTPRALVGAITGESGIPGRSIGAIDIQNRFSIVEVVSDLAEDVVNVLNRGVFISGIKVSVKLDGDADAAHSRKSFTPGARRQHPGKFGKKPRGAISGRKTYQEPK